MPDTVVVTEQEAAPDPATLEAERAAAAANHAAEAAAHAIGMAEAESARTVEAAATEIASYEERLSQCLAEIQTLTQSQSDLRNALDRDRQTTATALTEAMAAISSIQQARESAPESLRSPPSEPDQEGPQTEPEPSPPRRAHRWI
jgi:chromosome segregation ATPase